MFSRFCLALVCGLAVSNPLGLIRDVSAHAYFKYPVPRVVYSTVATSDINATDAGTAKAPGLDQGPVFGLYADTALPAGDPALTTCSRSLVYAGNGTDPGLGATSASTLAGQTWTAGSTVTITIFVSQIHSPENQTLHPTDGFVVNYRDANVAGSTFAPLTLTVPTLNPPASVLGPASFTGSSTTGTGPFPTINWFYYQSVTVGLTVPTTATTAGVLQFFWRNNDINPAGTTPGVVFMSCADIVIAKPNGSLHSASVNTVFTVMAVAIVSALQFFVGKF